MYAASILSLANEASTHVIPTNYFQRILATVEGSKKGVENTERDNAGLENKGPNSMA